MVTIDVIKHSASIAWDAADGASGAIPSGRLSLHTEDALAEKPDARNAAIVALKNLTTLLHEHGLEVTVITHNQHDSLLGEAAA